MELSLLRYQQGSVGFDRVLNAQVSLAHQQEQMVIAMHDNALDMVHVYKALGGGWQCFTCPDADAASPPASEGPPLPPVAAEVKPAAENVGQAKQP